MRNGQHFFQIAGKYGCDKGLTGPSALRSANNYCDVYEAYLGHRRLEKLRIMEIGLGVEGDKYETDICEGSNSSGGASLRLWTEYLPNSEIVGLDINDASHLNSDRVTIHQCDQSDRVALSKIAELYADRPFDMIIDDGSHVAGHQQLTLEVLFTLLKPGGVYVIEDLSDFGYGARQGSQFGDPNNVPTRHLLWSFIKTGSLLKPNAVEDDGFFSEVESITFFCPRPFLRFRDLAIEALRLVAGRAGRGLLRLELNPDSHKLVVLRKAH